jgi:hypothetical protein
MYLANCLEQYIGPLFTGLKKGKHSNIQKLKQLLILIALVGLK